MDEPTALSSNPGQRQSLSAVVISYNRADIIGTCLRALAFADEVLLIDKSSTDDTRLIGSRYADRVMTVPWSPTVEETRELAASQAKHDWLLLLDDDECLSVEAVRFIQDELKDPRADVYALPQRHYILGRHDEAAYYWPEFQPRLFRRGSVHLSPTVHGGTVRAPDARLYTVPPETGVCMHHLSHKNVAQWIEKTNRYTNNPDRLSTEDFTSDLAMFAHKQIDTYLEATRSTDRSDYPTAVAVLRSLYNMVDRLKRWETENGINGDASFQAVCRRLEAEYDAAFPPRKVLTTPEPLQQGVPSSAPAPAPTSASTPMADGRTAQIFQDAIRHLRTTGETSQRRADELIQEQRAFFSAETERLRLLYEADVAQQKRSFDAEAERLRILYDTENQKIRRIFESESISQHNKIQALELNRRTLTQERRSLADVIRRLRMQIDDERLRQEERDRRVSDLERHVDDLLGSTSWKITHPLRILTTALRSQVKLNRQRAALVIKASFASDSHARQILQTSLARRLRLSTNIGPSALPANLGIGTEHPKHLHSAPHLAAVESYASWSIRFDTPSLEHREWLIETANEIPSAGIICFFAEADLSTVARTLSAIRNQVGLRWSVSLVFSSQCDEAAVAYWRENAALDKRFLPAGVLPSEDILVLVQGGVVPRAHGLRLLVETLHRRPQAHLAYGDEDRLDEEGIPQDPWFKPRYSELLVRQGRLLGRMIGVRASSSGAQGLVKCFEAGGFSALQNNIMQMALKAGEAGCVHLPHVVFHETLPTQHHALQTNDLPEQLPIVSIIIPTRNGWHLLQPCLQSLRQTDWPADRLEIIVVDNGSDDPDILNEMKKLEISGFLRVQRDPRPFNYAQLNNGAVRGSRGSILVFLNNDTEVRDPAWLKRLVAYAMRPGAGAVGPKLLYGDGTVQHGGVILGVMGVAAHAHVHLGAQDGGYMGLANVTREMAAVTGACLAVTREAFDEVGGFNEELKIAFNDTVLCMDLLKQGRRNIYLAEALITHYESKTRGYDDTPEKLRIGRRETCLAWSFHAETMRDDPYYSPNLSLEQPHGLSFAPRRRPAWRPQPNGRLKVMMLSITHGRGHGVAVVIDQQVSALVKRGHEVVLAGHSGPNDFTYGGRPVLEVHDPRSAATLALDLEVDVIIAHTPPFFGVARWTGAFPPVISYDYGEPPPELFPDAVQRREINDIKNMELACSTAVYALSQAVADEALVEPRGILPIANSHLGRWDADTADRREAVRAQQGWTHKFVVLNVCRFGAGERRYKGVDTFIELRDALYAIDPVLAARAVFVLCGKGTEEDVALMEEAGLEVRPNVSDVEMSGLYAAADAYANFSLWEGYNLGIGQALAMGLPVVTSDIPAHRAFGVPVCRDAQEAAGVLAKIAAQPPGREPVIWEWDEAMKIFVTAVETVAAETPGLDWYPAR